MPRYTIRKCKQCGSLHETREWPSECMMQFARERSDLPMPAIRSDGMDTIVNHADGRLYDSRSAYERAVKAAGCEIIGNDAPDVGARTKPSAIKQDIKTAIEQLEGSL